ncbi:MAG: hypothetical protein Q8O67_31915 [Deltaproteobacteria bacterium]|nr:hypothetical protein [Deltaproteobacteria bacterium]
MISLEERLWLAAADSQTARNDLLAASLADGSWRESPPAWLRVARHVADGATEQLSEGPTLASLARTMASAALDDACRAVLTELAAGLRWRREEEALGLLCDWVASCAQPRDAAVIVAMIGAVHFHDPDPVARELPPSVMPLVDWLLRSGAAELRQHGQRSELDAEHQQHVRQSLRGGDLLLHLCRAVELHGRKEQLPRALHYFLAAPHSDLDHDVPVETVWRMLERCLEEGSPAGAAVDVVAVMARSMTPVPNKPELGYLLPGAHRFLPLVDDKYPLGRAALLQALLRGELSTDLAKQCLPFAMQHSAPDKALPSALWPAVHHRLGQMLMRDEAGGLSATAKAWGRRFVGAAAMNLRFPRFCAEAERILTAAAGRAWLRPIVAEGLCEVWPESTRAGAILRSGPPTSACIHAAIAANRSSGSQVGAVAASDLSPLRAELLRFVHHPWLRPIAGVDVVRLLDGVIDVRLEPQLPRELKVLIDQGVLYVDTVFAEGAYTRFRPDEALLESCLYVLHELVHVAQGFAEMGAVHVARGIGAEMTVMQIDLAADHVAALLLAELRPDWTVDALKDRIGRSLAAFPAGQFHTEASRHRKATRLVGSRFDLAVRRDLRVTRQAARTDTSDDAFYWLDFSPGGQHCLAFASSPITRLACPPLSLNDNDLQALAQAGDVGADFQRQLDVIDQIVGRLAGEAAATRW